jgi:hypothetical protein
MSRTFVRQDIQIRPSVLYDDTIAPTEADYETNPSHIEANLNHLRSQLQNFLNRDGAGFPSQDWWDDITAPSTLEAGTQRGIIAMNDALHLLEKKRVLRPVKLLSDVTVTASVAAFGTLTSTGAFLDTETVTIDGRVYTFQTALTDVDGNVAIGGSQAQAHENLRRAINLDGTGGVNYAASMTANTSVSAADTGTTNVITALAQGTQGNAITSVTSLTNASFAAGNFASGAGGDVEVLAAGELPTQLTAAVGAVTTLGTVVASATSFLSAGLDEVAGVNAMSPKNLLELVDGASGDPFLTAGVGESPAGKRIWGLLQGESGLTDGTTITDATTTRVQITFVIGNATNDDLILVDGEEMSGKTLNYCYRERVRLEDLSEGDFLNSASIDIGAGAVTPTRQVGYDNQGTTPVDVTTNSTLDLEGAGLVWEIRDDLEASMFVVTEGSAGGTSEIAFEADVDTFRSDALANDMDNGLAVDTGAAGTTINLGVTANQIDTSGALTVQGGAIVKVESTGDQLRFADTNEPAGWSEDGIQLSDAEATWTLFETNFGEVGLMDAINQAAISENRNKGVAIVTAATIVADTNVTGAAALNLDAQLPDYSTVTSFQADVDVFVNGVLMRGDDSTTGANDHDVYPGTAPATGDLKFEFLLRGTGSNADVITMIVYGV